jgi:Tic22-like family
MNLLISSLLIAFSVLQTVSSSGNFGLGEARSTRLFGIRGGGLFGGGKDADAGDETASAVAEKKVFPAMTQEEVESWLEHVPVFAVTDSNGAGVVLKPDDDSSVFYFFLNPLAANATLSQLKSANEEMDLKVSAFSLGKIWFRLLNSDSNQEVLVSGFG